MIKNAPSIGRLIAMVAFTLSVIGLLMFLWLAFGGPLPLKPEGYRVTVSFPEAATLAEESDVRLAGVNVGKVKTKALDKGGARTKVTLELDSRYAPIPKDSRAILRQKTLLGETYVEIAPGNKRSGMLEDGQRLPNSQVEPTVELDEILSSFDDPTRKAFQDWMKELAVVIDNGRSSDFNDAIGSLPGFSADGAKLLSVLDEQEQAVHRLVKNTGVVFGAINERRGALRQLIANSNNTFEATARSDAALAETFRIFPTFLDESRVTMARLEGFSRNTRPLVNDLKGPADDLGPTVRDLGDLAPDAERLFRELPPLIRTSETTLPALEKTLDGAEPLFEAAHVFLPELNPILSYFNFHQTTISGFLTNATADLSGQAGGERYQTQVAIIEPRSLQRFTKRPYWERGNAYPAPNALQRGIALGGIESADCTAAGGEQREPNDNPPLGQDPTPPCFVQPPSLYNGQKYPRLRKGVAPNEEKPGFREGGRSGQEARDPHPDDPLH
jgi:phospholipid/cholesterol/gamma-HCH transport system substrate-binding protein